MYKIWDMVTVKMNEKNSTSKCSFHHTKTFQLHEKSKFTDRITQSFADACKRRIHFDDFGWEKRYLVWSIVKRIFHHVKKVFPRILEIGLGYLVVYVLNSHYLIFKHVYIFDEIGNFSRHFVRISTWITW